MSTETLISHDALPVDKLFGFSATVQGIENSVQKMWLQNVPIQFIELCLETTKIERAIKH